MERLVAKTFMPIGIFNEDCCEQFKLHLYNVSSVVGDELVNDIEKRLDKALKKQTKEFDDIIDYIANYWGKFLYIKFSYNANYNSDRNDNPKWETQSNIVVMPYYYNATNKRLFGLFCKINDNYVGGIKDESIDLFKKAQTYRIDITEISEEEFFEFAKVSLNDCFKQRKDKINSDKYKCEKNGYIWQNETDIF